MNPYNALPWHSDGAKVLDADGVIVAITSPPSGEDVKADVNRAAHIATCWNICHLPLAAIVRQRDGLLRAMKDIYTAADHSAHADGIAMMAAEAITDTENIDNQSPDEAAATDRRDGIPKPWLWG